MNREKIVVEYCAEGDPVSDFAVADWSYNFLRGSQTHYRVSTSLPIDAVRLMIVQGKLDAEDVTFSYSGLVFQANRYGAIPDWPIGFADRSGAYAHDILLAATKKLQKERDTQS